MNAAPVIVGGVRTPARYDFTYIHYYIKMKKIFALELAQNKVPWK